MYGAWGGLRRRASWLLAPVEGPEAVAVGLWVRCAAWPRATPSAIRLASRLEPPALTSGRGRPVIGTSPTLTATWITRCEASGSATPPAGRASSALARGREHQQRGQEGVEQQEAHATDEPELLDHGEHAVAVALGQGARAVRHALAQPVPSQPPFPSTVRAW